MQHRRRRPQKPIEPWKGPKPKLLMKVTYQCWVHYLDLQAYLAKVYKMRDYDVASASGGTPGCCPEFIVTGDLGGARNIDQQVDAIRRGRRTRNLTLILNLLCCDGFIPAGKYIIDMTTLPLPLISYTKLLQQHKDPTHPECMAFKKRHPDESFTRRARVLDALVIEQQETNDG